MVGPSPVTSNGTETTEIEDEAAEHVAEEVEEGRPLPSKTPALGLQSSVGSPYRTEMEYY